MIHLDYRDSRPIYEQVKDGLRRLMVTGVMAPGEKLPSVRALAAELAINPNTIQRAYRELELSGYLYSVPGKGNFAAGHREVDESRKTALLEQLRAAAKELRYLGVTEEELLRALSEGGETHD